MYISARHHTGMGAASARPILGLNPIPQFYYLLGIFLSSGKIPALVLHPTSD
jgi:hypothetical protein